MDNATQHVPSGAHAGGDGGGWLSSWHGMVSVAGITFAVVLVLMTLAFLCYHRVAGSRRPRKTQVGQVLLRPRPGSGSHDPRSRRADGASASLWTASPADSPTRTFLLHSSSTAPCQPAYYVDGPYPAHELLESNVDTLGRPCPAYRIYGFPAYYGGLQDDVVAGRHCDAPACVKCSQRPSHSLCVGCTQHVAGGHHGEVFIDGPPSHDRPGGGVDQPGAGVERAAGGAGEGRARPPTEGSDSETTPVKTLSAPCRTRPETNDDVKRLDQQGTTHVGLHEVVVPASSGQKRCESDETKRQDHHPAQDGTYVGLLQPVVPGCDGEEARRPTSQPAQDGTAYVGLHGIDSPTRRGSVEGKRRNAAAVKRPDVAHTAHNGTCVGLEDTVVPRPDVDNDDVKRPAAAVYGAVSVRGAARPDGRSPDDGGGGGGAATTSCSTLSELDCISAELEYDDYVPPQLPGSYFTMDPHAYTLTWSQHHTQQQQQQQQQQQHSLSASDASLDCR